MIAERLSVGASDECGCPEEEWDINGVFTTIHLEEDGGGHIFIYCGDWEFEKTVEASTMPALRAAAIEWVRSLPPEGGQRSSE